MFKDIKIKSKSKIRCLEPGTTFVVQAAQGQQSSRFAQNSPADTAPASLSKGPGIATPSAAHKHAPSEAYELEDLDEDWVAMLNMLDSRLLEVGSSILGGLLFI